MDKSIILKLIIAALPIIIAVTFHEVAHGYAANRLGDPTAKMQGRLTLNPLAHIDILGTIIVPFMLFMFSGYVIGWAKPVPINPYNFRNPKRDMAISAASGPITNIILAFLSISGIWLVIVPLSKILPAGLSNTILTPLFYMFRASAVINVILAVFNMIPLPPLDGGRVAVGLLPHREAEALSRLEPYGFMIVILLFFVFGIGRYIFGPVLACVYALTGG